jgi:hypothetical protein
LTIFIPSDSTGKNDTYSVIDTLSIDPSIYNRWNIKKAVEKEISGTFTFAPIDIATYFDITSSSKITFIEGGVGKEQSLSCIRTVVAENIFHVCDVAKFSSLTNIFDFHISDELKSKVDADGKALTNDLTLSSFFDINTCVNLSDVSVAVNIVPIQVSTKFIDTNIDDTNGLVTANIFTLASNPLEVPSSGYDGSPIVSTDYTPQARVFRPNGLEYTSSEILVIDMGLDGTYQRTYEITINLIPGDLSAKVAFILGFEKPNDGVAASIQTIYQQLIYN